MANQYNFRQTVRPALSPRYNISRPMKLASEDLIESITPGEFGFYPNEHLMLSLYNPTDNTFIDSQRADLADNVLKVVNVVYSDGSYSNYITLDFTKLNELYPNFLIPGVFDLDINIFEDMIGSEEDKKLVIEEISDSRTEIKLKFNTFFSDIEKNELDNIIIPSIPRPFLGGVIDNLLVTSEETNDPIIGITSGEILSRMQTEEGYRAVTNLALTDNFKEVIAKIMKSARDKILIELQTADYRMRQDVFTALVYSNITSAFMEARNLFNDQVTVS